MRAQDRSKWRPLVETAMLTGGRALDDDDDDDDDDGSYPAKVIFSYSFIHIVSRIATEI